MVRLPSALAATWSVHVPLGTCKLTWKQDSVDIVDSTYWKANGFHMCMLHTSWIPPLLEVVGALEYE